MNRGMNGTSSDRQRLLAQARTIHDLRSEISELRREIESRDEGWLLLDAGYADALRTLQSLAYNPVRRGEQRRGGKPGSTPPPSDPVAAGRLEREQRHQQKRARELLNPAANRKDEAGWIDSHVGESREA